MTSTITTNNKKRQCPTEKELLIPPTKKGRGQGDPAANGGRIGRACDRCQTRKLACTKNPKGCEQCHKGNYWCTVTDGIPERMFYRGEVEFLNKSYKNHLRIIAAYRAELKLHGVGRLACDVEEEGIETYNLWQDTRRKYNLDFIAVDVENDEDECIDSYSPPSKSMPFDDVKQEPLDVPPTPSSTCPSPSPVVDSPLLPDLRHGLPHGTNFLGLSSTDGPNRGLRLHAMGFHIPLQELMEPDLDDADESTATNKKSVRNRTYKSAMATMFHEQPAIRQLSLPSSLVQLVDGFMGMVNPYYPLVVRSKLESLIHQYLHDKEFKATPAQEVIVHTVAACMSFQAALRSQGEPMSLKNGHASSNEHFHYALGFYSKICTGKSIDDMLALALLCVHTRSFPKPDLGFWFAGATLKQLIALGYHRKTNQALTELSDYEHEMRKRIFHTVLHIHVVACARTATPMPIRWADVDIEIPEVLPEIAFVGDSIHKDAEGPCEYLPGLKLFRLTPILLAIYNGLYSSQMGPAKYAEFIGKTNASLLHWRETKPSGRDLLELQARLESNPQGSSTSTSLLRLQHQWLETAYHEAQLLLHHPSLALSKAQDVRESNLSACVAAARGLYLSTSELKRLNSLEITWYSCALYLLAISTGLYGLCERQELMSPEQFNNARNMYVGWNEILAYIGKLLGANAQFFDGMNKHIEASFNILATRQEALREEAAIAHAQAQAEAAQMMQAGNQAGHDGATDPQGSQLITPNEYMQPEAHPMINMVHPPMLTHATSSFSQTPSGSVSPASGLAHRQRMGLPPLLMPAPTSTPYTHSAPVSAAGYSGWTGQYFQMPYQGGAVPDGMLHNNAFRMPEGAIYHAKNVFNDPHWNQFVHDTNEGVQNPVLTQNYNAASVLMGMGNEGPVDPAFHSQHELIHWPQNVMSPYPANVSGVGNPATNLDSINLHGYEELDSHAEGDGESQN